MSYYNFTVPGTPEIKSRPRVTRHGTFTPKKTIDAEKRIAAVFASLYHKEQLITGPVEMIVDFWLPDYAHKDVDNLAKLVMDALNKVAYEDDSQVVTILARKHLHDMTMPGKHGPRQYKSGDPLTIKGEPYDPHTTIQILEVEQ